MTTFTKADNDQLRYAYQAAGRLNGKNEYPGSYFPYDWQPLEVPHNNTLSFQIKKAADVLATYNLVFGGNHLGERIRPFFEAFPNSWTRLITIDIDLAEILGGKDPLNLVQAGDRMRCKGVAYRETHLVVLTVQEVTIQALGTELQVVTTRDHLRIPNQDFEPRPRPLLS